MKILLIEPQYPKIILDTTSIPLGLASIATVLKENGYDVTCFDGSVNDIAKIAPDYQKYDIIGLQFHSFEAIGYCLKLARDIKISSKSIIVAGGVAATLYLSELINHKDIDYIIPYEGEDIFLEFVKTFLLGGDLNKVPGLASKSNGYSVNSSVHFRKNIDSFPIPDRDLFDWSKYGQWSIITSRGCPFNCKFCTVPTFWKHTYRQRSPQHIFKEIEILVEKYSVKKLFILDDSFTVNKDRTIKLLNLIIDNKKNIEWACLTRADLLDDELLDLMKKSGCSTISIGVESANQDTLDILNKGLKLETIANAIFLIKKHSIRVRCSFIFGFPNEKEEHLRNNIEFLKITRPNEIQIYPLFPYYGTEINRNNTFKDIDFSVGKDALNPLIGTENIDKQTIVYYVKQCVKEMQELGYVWLSSHSVLPQKNDYENVIMTEFAPIQALKKNY